MSTTTITLEPIGFVKMTSKEFRDKANISKIVLREDLAEALEGIEGFSHLFILFWMNRITDKERATKKAHPRGRPDTPLLGIFATRTPYRPNPIGLTLVKLLGVEDSILTVQGLDAYDGTPVLDVKPFDFWDMAEDAKVPGWWRRLEKERTERRRAS